MLQVDEGQIEDSGHAMTRLEFLTPNVAVQKGFLSVRECAEAIAAVDAAPSEKAEVVRAGESILDESLRSCFEHHCSDVMTNGLAGRLLSYFDAHRGEFGSDADHLYGPYFMSYRPGSFFRCHRDVGNHANDPVRLAAHRWSLLVFLNGREDGPLPAFDGGALLIYEAGDRAPERRVVIVPEPGMFVLFRSSLLHEVAKVTGGTRYAVAAWMAESTNNPFGAPS